MELFVFFTFWGLSPREVDNEWSWMRIEWMEEVDFFHMMFKIEKGNGRQRTLVERIGRLDSSTVSSRMM